MLNLQGDVVKLIRPNASGTSYTTYAAYSYDAWGNILTQSGTMADINPLRYRGYYYDTETKFYYLQSRYYDPVIHRFINADSYASTGQGFIGYNMFAYCGNNPLVYSDPKGDDAVILYDSDFPGHIGALIQDMEGNWWHFYWGAQNGSSRFWCIFGIKVEAKTWCIEYDDDIDLESINNKGQFPGDYEEMLYLEGDYSTSVFWAQNASGKYSLYSNNCMHKTLEILALGFTIDSQTFFNIKGKEVLPSRAFESLKKKLSCIREVS